MGAGRGGGPAPGDLLMAVQGPFEPEPGRKIVICMSDGKLYHFSVLEFVVKQTMEALAVLYGREPTWEEVSAHTGVAATELCEQGWFAPVEYMEEWTQAQFEDLDTELKELLGGDGDQAAPAGS